jgi:hypothetical protein
MAAAMAGCASAPAARFDREARVLGLAASTVASPGFTHRIAANQARWGDRLHLYLDGDGRPFVNRTHVARDPTSRDPLTLRLMEQDPNPAVLLGRPCYYGLGGPCEPRLWTTGRYGETVVQSMVAAARAVIRERAPRVVVLIGYSGGGTLAVLMAEQMPEVAAVMTVAANLDIDAWTRLHGYSPLAESTNPVKLNDPRNDLVHLHFAGGRDANVPPQIHEAARARFPGGRFFVLADHDHRCCWTDTWPERLADLDAALAGNASGIPPRGG